MTSQYLVSILIYVLFKNKKVYLVKQLAKNIRYIYILSIRDSIKYYYI